jgi:16S rRNA (guanine527-N7)-methyltransferase
MSAAAQRRLRELDPSVSRETLERLEIMVETLLRWQKAINLVGRATLDDVWTRHILDSAQLAALIPKEARTLADLGSGAGFPGIVLAALRPDLDVTLIESDARKSAYLGEAARKMALPKPPKVLVSRIEAAPPTKVEIVTARALAPLAKLLLWADRHRADPAICLFHKGKDWRAELAGAMKDWEIEFTPQPSVTDRDAVILRIGSYRAKDLRDR